LALLNLVVNARIHRALVTSSRSSRGTQRGTVRGSIGWLKHRNLASSGQSQIGGLPIGVKLEGRLRIPSAILGGGGIEIRSRSASRDPSGRRAQTRQSRKAFSDAGPRVRILLPPGESPLRTWTTDDSGVLGQCRWETEPSAVSPGIDHDDIRKSGFEINGQILPGAVPFPWNTREALSPSLEIVNRDTVAQEKSSVVTSAML